MPAGDRIADRGDVLTGNLNCGLGMIRRPRPDAGDRPDRGGFSRFSLCRLGPLGTAFRIGLGALRDLLLQARGRALVPPTEHAVAEAAIATRIARMGSFLLRGRRGRSPDPAHQAQSARTRQARPDRPHPGRRGGPSSASHAARLKPRERRTDRWSGRACSLVARSFASSKRADAASPSYFRGFVCARMICGARWRLLLTAPLVTARPRPGVSTCGLCSEGPAPLARAEPHAVGPRTSP